MSHAYTAEAQRRENSNTLPGDIAVAWRPQQALASPPFHEWQTPAGVCTLRFHRMPQGYLLRFPDIADFILSADGQLTSVQAVPGVDRDYLASLCSNQVQPLSLSRQGRLVLHAGVVEVAEDWTEHGMERSVETAVLFLGRSGAGKSTLVKACADAGYRFLSDDCALFVEEGDGMRVLPGLPGVRLRSDSSLALMQDAAAKKSGRRSTAKGRSNGKVFVAAGKRLLHCPDSRPLAAIYLLEQSGSGAVSIGGLGAREALMALLAHSFLLDLEEQAMLRRHFTQLSSLVRQAGVFSLSYPRDYQRLPEVVDAVMRHVRPRLTREAC